MPSLIIGTRSLVLKTMWLLGAGVLAAAIRMVNQAVRGLTLAQGHLRYKAGMELEIRFQVLLGEKPPVSLALGETKYTKL